ncbi:MULTISPECIES: hypothetical protein [Arthrobacter]|uniref:Uncharacterized protein n=1 Tax=Arthrobacter terricola TaxID=2547396 RepID=A0A4V2ZRT3_9MICC|nr:MULTISPECIES: hypothetical protein [Arthrobacter]MBT8163591.1 hypothetical protein [Arthrobacter sp. GN70]TDF88532.1 hypothetical protein E1809_23735 [Arthrobacter terricola]
MTVTIDKDCGHLCPTETALRQDLEVHTKLATARHHIENLLAAFSHAIAGNHQDLLTALLRNVRVTLVGSEHCHELAPVVRLLQLVAPSGTRVWFLTSNLGVAYEDRDVTFTAVYQILDAGSRHNRLGIGSIRGSLRSGAETWTWSSLEITTERGALRT